MHTPPRRAVLLTAAISLGLAALTACSTTPAANTEPATTATATATATASVPDELTVEEATRDNPPPPANVQAQWSAGGVKLTWDAPPAVRGPHTYSDRVVTYRVHRKGPGDTELRPIGFSPTYQFVDGTPASGTTYQYAVSSVREHQIDGSRSDAVSISVPSPAARWH